MRNVNNIGAPKGGLGVPIASQGFVTGPGTPGIVVQAPQFEGVENVAFQKFVFGVTTTNVESDQQHLSLERQPLEGDRRAHPARWREFQYAQVDIDPNAQFNGTFSFQGTKPDPGSRLPARRAERLHPGRRHAVLHPSKYPAPSRRTAGGFGAKLTVNYGVRYDFMEPWYDKYNQIQTFIPGPQSVVYPTGPAGFVYPGDDGIERTLSPARHKFSPRVGVAYVPSFSDGPLKALLRQPIDHSIPPNLHPTISRTMRATHHRPS